MHFLRPISAVLRRNHRHFYDDAASTRFVRDKGLDHAVLRERNLKPLINLKNFIKSEPSKSLPLSIITESKLSLELPIRPIEFIRRYPLVFQEFCPGNIAAHPHVKLTPEVLELDAEESLVYETLEYKKDLADRLLKLLMIGRTNRISLSVLGRLKWELGLPDNFVQFVVPDFPDYFEVKKGVGGDDGVLELVCWTDELAVSAMEMVWGVNGAKTVEGEKKDSGKAELRRRRNRVKKEEKLQPFHFPLKYSSGFEMDKTYKMWVDEFQKLPYVSPYEIETNVATMSDEYDKWAVAVLHEVLNLFVGMKGEKESVLCIGECLGLRGRFKRALLQHPGIFYVSSKNRIYTVVLRDGYKRGALIKKNPLMEMRFKYLNLMHTTKEGDKETSVQQKDGKPKNKDKGEDEQNDENDESDESDEEEDDEVSGFSNEDSDSDSDSEEDENEDSFYDDNVNKRGRSSNETKFSPNRSSRGVGRSSERAITSERMGERSPRSNRKIDYKGGNSSPRSNRKVDYQGENLYPRSNRNMDYKGDNSSPRFNRKIDNQGENSSPRSNRKTDYKGENSFSRSQGSVDGFKQGRGAERENNMSGERQFNRQRRGAEREDGMSGERQFDRQRRGAEREDSMSGERQFNRQRRGPEREGNMSGERQFNRQRHGTEREGNMSRERQFNRQRRGTEREGNMSGERQFNRERRGSERENNMSGERQFNRQRRGAERENNMSGDGKFNRQRKRV